jgi:hypothetical protein
MDLQVEHSVAPLAIDTAAPRFSWQHLVFRGS